MPTAASVTSFKDTLGVVSHIWQGSDQLNNAIAELNYMGVGQTMENAPASASDVAYLAQIAQSGVKLNLGMPPDDPGSSGLTTAGLQTYLDFIKQLIQAAPGSVVAITGYNEINNWPVNYNGLTQGTDVWGKGGQGSYASALNAQTDLYNMVRGDSAFAGIPVFDLTAGNSGADSAQLGLDKIAGHADVPNIHPYVAGGQSPQDAFAAELQVEYPGTSSPSPVAVTEFGVTTTNGVTEQQKANNILGSYLTYFKNGSLASEAYVLNDESGGNPGGYGLFNSDQSTPHEAATDLHNLTTILADSGSGSFTPGSLNYTVSGLSSTGSDLLFQKSDGTFDIALWNDVPAGGGGSSNVTVDLGGTQSGVKVYDPTAGTTAVQDVGSASSVSVTVGDSPVIIEVGGGGAPAASSGSTPSTTAAAGTVATTTPATGTTSTGSTGTNNSGGSNVTIPPGTPPPIASGMANGTLDANGNTIAPASSSSGTSGTSAPANQGGASASGGGSSQGVVTERPLGSTSAPEGYEEYLPAGYDGVQKFPLMVFLHGIGENGNGTTDLPSTVIHGPIQAIESGQGAEASQFIVLSPQQASGIPSADDVKNFLDYAVANYAVDPSRIYLTGLSAGAMAEWNYLGKYGDSVVAAAVPLSGQDPGGAAWSAQGGSLAQDTAIWGIHGTVDGSVPFSNDQTLFDNLINTPEPRSDVAFTPVPGADHDIPWDGVYDGTWNYGSLQTQGNAPANGDIYAWMLDHAKGGSANGSTGVVATAPSTTTGQAGGFTPISTNSAATAAGNALQQTGSGGTPQPSSGSASSGTPAGEVILTSGGSWTVPMDWSPQNEIDVIGGGGGGANGTSQTSGGGGAFSQIMNVSLQPGQTISYGVGSGGAGGALTANDSLGNYGYSGGGNGGTTWFGGNDAGSALVAAEGGQGGARDTSSGAPGGQASNGIGSLKTSGGEGAYKYTTDDSSPAGGGGAGGPNGDGGAGGAGSFGVVQPGGTTAAVGGGGANGGQPGGADPRTNDGVGTPGGNNYLGAGGGAGGQSGSPNGQPGTAGAGGGGGYSNFTTMETGSGGAGGNGTEWGAAGAGGGGGGGGHSWTSQGDFTGANGGLYGGGGGTGAYAGTWGPSGPTSGGYGFPGGDGGQGVIVIRYGPGLTGNPASAVTASANQGNSGAGAAIGSGTTAGGTGSTPSSNSSTGSPPSSTGSTGSTGSTPDPALTSTGSTTAPADPALTSVGSGNAGVGNNSSTADLINLAPPDTLAQMNNAIGASNGSTDAGVSTVPTATTSGVSGVSGNQPISSVTDLQSPAQLANAQNALSTVNTTSTPGSGGSPAETGAAEANEPADDESGPEDDKPGSSTGSTTGSGSQSAAANPTSSGSGSSTHTSQSSSSNGSPAVSTSSSGGSGSSHTPTTSSTGTTPTSGSTPAGGTSLSATLANNPEFKKDLQDAITALQGNDPMGALQDIVKALSLALSTPSTSSATTTSPIQTAALAPATGAATTTAPQTSGYSWAPDHSIANGYSWAPNGSTANGYSWNTPTNGSQPASPNATIQASATVSTNNLTPADAASAAQNAIDQTSGGSPSGATTSTPLSSSSSSSQPQSTGSSSTQPVTSNSSLSTNPSAISPTSPSPSNSPSGAPSGSVATTPPASSSSTGVPANASGVPQWKHVVVVVEENHTPDQVLSAGPFMQSLVAKGATISGYTALTHPSQPNYIALMAGDTKGVTDDNPVTVSGPTIADSLSSVGKSFTYYVEDGSPQKHNPMESISGQSQYEKNFSSFPTSGFDSLPNVSFVSPNLQNDMHDGTPAQADTWLQNNLGAYAAYAADPANQSLLVITADEDDGSSAANNVPLLMVGAGVNPGSYNQSVDHYSLGSTLASSQGALGPGAEAAAPVFSGMFTAGGLSSTVSSPATVQAGLNPTSSIGPVTGVPRTGFITNLPTTTTTNGGSASLLASQQPVVTNTATPVLH